MRVLFTSPAGLGHVHPMVPLARSLLAQGHDVLWATPPEAVDHVERFGIRAVAVGQADLTNVAEIRRRHPELAELPPAEAANVLFGKIFAASMAPSVLPDLVAVAEGWRPDLVVADAGELSSHVVAAERGIPSVTKGFGPLLPERRYANAAEDMAPLWRSRGLEPRPLCGAFDHLYLHIYPPALEPMTAPYVPRHHLLRPLSEDGQVETAAPLPLPAGRPTAPLVYVTMGTVFNDAGPLATVLAGVHDLDVRVLVTVGPRADPAVLGPQPSHVRVERYVPQTAVLPHCDVVVSHAGSGTTLASAALGLPQLSLPQGADQFLNAEAIERAGAGIALMPGACTPDTVAAAVTQLLDEPTYATVARQVSESIASMPSPDDVVAVLEGLVAAG